VNGVSRNCKTLGQIAAGEFHQRKSKIEKERQREVL